MISPRLGVYGKIPDSTTLNYSKPPRGTPVMERARFGSWAEYDNETSTRNSQAKRLGRTMAHLVTEKRAKGCLLVKVAWFDRNEPDLPFPRIGWKVDMLVPKWGSR